MPAAGFTFFLLTACVPQVYQTGDLGAMEAGDTRCPQLLSLRAAIYSPDFRAFVERLTGCGPLSERTDCSCNVYAHGGGLLCHDDVIGTRRVSCACPPL